MYSFTAFWFDALTLNAPYPVCHANLMLCSPIHREELAFSRWIEAAKVISGGNAIRRCAWFPIPPAVSTGTRMFCPMPLK